MKYVMYLGVFVLAGCGLVQSYTPESLSPTSKKVTSESDVSQLEASGYQCHREILAQAEQDCTDVLAGSLCRPGRIKYGDWICDPVSPNPSTP